MALNPLTLDVTYAVAGRRFQATVLGLTAGSTLEVLADGTPGFGSSNGRVYIDRMPGSSTPATIVLRESKAGETPRESRIDISVDGIALGAAGLAATNTATGDLASLDKLFRNMQRALDSNPYDLPNYGSGPSAGLTAPTLTWEAAPTGLTQQRLMNDAAGNDWAAFYGGIPSQISGSAYGFPVVTSTAGAVSGAGGRAGVAWAVETETNADKISFRVLNSQAIQFRVLVDGQFVGRTPAKMDNVVPGSPQHLTVAFASGASAKPRRIRYESELNGDFRAIYLATTHRIIKPEPVDFVRSAWIGDSYTAFATNAGSVNSFAHDNYPSITHRLLGVHDGNNLGVAGTGFASDNVSLGLRYSSRMNDLALLQARPGGVDMVVLQGSINDRDKSPATIQSEASAVIAQARAIVGAGKPIIVLGVAPGALGASAYTVAAGVLAAEQALIAAVAAANDPLVAFVPLSTATPTPVLAGDNATGTASLYTQTDLIHPTFGASVPGVGGMEYLARAAAKGIRAAITAMRR
ncbi:SGNH/GDSL hydrolase family protein [Sphingomonas phyllosphaerae]|uniref:SGNH/GDSL hydrolase family protein n=1 Tax=Sphingomonas phyllosphaerae TaxID=257003 RepID=UPI002FFCAC56